MNDLPLKPEQIKASSDWWCPNCKEVVNGHVTFYERHELCGAAVESVENGESVTAMAERLARLTEENGKLRIEVAQCKQDIKDNYTKGKITGLKIAYNIAMDNDNAHRNPTLAEQIGEKALAIRQALTPDTLTEKTK